MLKAVSYGNLSKIPAFLILFLFMVTFTSLLKLSFLSLKIYTLFPSYSEIPSQNSVKITFASSKILDIFLKALSIKSKSLSSFITLFKFFFIINNFIIRYFSLLVALVFIIKHFKKKIDII